MPCQHGCVFTNSLPLEQSKSPNTSRKEGAAQYISTLYPLLRIPVSLNWVLQIQAFVLRLFQPPCTASVLQGLQEKSHNSGQQRMLRVRNSTTGEWSLSWLSLSAAINLPVTDFLSQIFYPPLFICNNSIGSSSDNAGTLVVLEGTVLQCRSGSV